MPLPQAWMGRSKTKSNLPKTLRKKVRGRGLLHDRQNPLPESWYPGSGLRRDGKDLLDAMLALQGSEALTQHVIRQPVRLRPNDDKRPLRLLEIEDQLSVTRLRGDIGIHQADAQGQSFSLAEVRLDEQRPLCRDGLRDLRISIAWKVREDQRRNLLLSPTRSLMQGKEVDRPRPPGGGGHPRLLGAEEGVDQRRLSDVRSPQECYLGRAMRLRFAGKVSRIGGGEQKDRIQPHLVQSTGRWADFDRK